MAPLAHGFTLNGISRQPGACPEVELPSSHESAPGTQLGPYEVTTKIG